MSLGDKVDVDFGDCLDYFAADRGTRAILLYVESINDARKFMSAARAAARAKPVVVIKSGRHAQGARAAATHTGALAGSDAVYDAAFRRAGLLRVLDLDELFAAAETLGRQKPFPGKRLAILTNGGGVGVLAVDRLIDLGGTLAALSPETRRAARTRAAADLVAREPGRHHRRRGCGALRGGARGAARRRGERRRARPERADRARLRVARRRRRSSDDRGARPAAGFRRKPVFAVWLGEDRRAAERASRAARIPALRTEADAVRGFMHLVRYREAQDALMETPDSLPQRLRARHGRGPRDRRAVRRGGPALARSARGQRAAARLRHPGRARDARRDAGGGGGGGAADPRRRRHGRGEDPVARHRAQVRHRRREARPHDARRPCARRRADIFERAARLKPERARSTGVTVQPMVRRPKARELIAGIADDPTFGPVMVFGRGGTAVEVINDKALALPPLDLKLADDLIARTRRRRASSRPIATCRRPTSGRSRSCW